MDCLNSGTSFLLSILFCVQAEQNRSMLLPHKIQAFCIQPQASCTSKRRESDRGSARGQQRSTCRQDCLFCSLPSPAACADAEGDPLLLRAGAPSKVLCALLLSPENRILLAVAFSRASLLSICPPQEHHAACQLLRLYFCPTVVAFLRRLVPLFFLSF